MAAVWEAAAHLSGMATTTTTITASTVAVAGGRQPRPKTPGARLAASSRTAQGFAATVDDPVVLARLRDLCAAPSPQPRRARLG
ncbi:MAG: hypothetical protein LBO20_08565 [Bifidobacteriaceae bacterium]|nr:hypothetical protein [Bifidobacteriaceae bacterium]